MKRQQQIEADAASGRTRRRSSIAAARSYLRHSITRGPVMNVGPGSGGAAPPKRDAAAARRAAERVPEASKRPLPPPPPPPQPRAGRTALFGGMADPEPGERAGTLSAPRSRPMPQYGDAANNQRYHSNDSDTRYRSHHTASSTHGHSGGGAIIGVDNPHLRAHPDAGNGAACSIPGCTSSSIFVQ